MRVVNLIPIADILHIKHLIFLFQKLQGIGQNLSMRQMVIL